MAMAFLATASVFIVGLIVSVRGSYYPPIVPYGPIPASAGYLLPAAAYVPPYAAYHAAAVAAGPPSSSSLSAGDYQRPHRDQAPPAAQQPKHYQHDAKYYYGGKFQGSCSNDGLYYKDDAAFVICSNGYPSDMACPPGTKTAEYPSYQAGYYYGYTDLCSVNLVDYGYGPETYSAASSQPKANSNNNNNRDSSSSLGYKDKSYANNDKDDYYPGSAPAPNNKDTYSTPKLNSYSLSSSEDSNANSYSPPKSGYNTASSSNNNYPSASYQPKSKPLAADYPPKDGSYSSGGKDSYPSLASKYPQSKPDSFYPANSKLDNSKPAAAAAAYNPYVQKDSYGSKDTAGNSGYAPSNPPAGGYQSRDSFSAKDAYLQRPTGYSSPSSSDDYGKVTNPAKIKYPVTVDNDNNNKY